MHGKLSRIVVCLFLGVSLTASIAQAKPRTWTDVSGKTVKADFVRLFNGGVVLKMSSGQVKTIPFTQFSAEDQQFVRDLVKGTPDEAQLPKEGAGGGAAGPGGVPGGRGVNVGGAPAIGGPGING
ncbi:MAG: SHD1 domain-containing protein, partial [Planctomycetaceae bacterium]